MDYKKIYDALISRAQNRNLEEYREKHHIVPRCMNGTDDETNLVFLTPEEHFVAHQLLVKIYPDNDKLIFALVIMSGKNSTTNKLFGWHRRKLSETQRKLHTGTKMPPRDPEHTRKIAEANTGKRHTQETKDQISQAKLGTEPWNKGKSGSQIAWNKGIKTGVKTEGCFKKGGTPWNKGLTKETDPRVADYGKSRIETNIKKRLTADTDSTIIKTYTALQEIEMNTKVRAQEIYNQHLALASTDGRGFRKAVMDQLMSEMGVSLASAATHYNNCKKGSSPVEGLGRAPVPKGVRKPGGKGKAQVQLQDDNECVSVIELIENNVARCQSFLTQGDASETFDAKIMTWPKSEWVMIWGLGPNSGDIFKLEAGEKEIKRYTPKKITEDITSCCV